ncbi:MAG: DNA primase catalytic core [Planctomycetota bacterium]|jgi:DNA primase catalytic core
MEKHDLKQVIESVKLRISIEDAVRERVPDLKRAGRLYTACCPFHQEKTPSFKVDPHSGFWKCYGACGVGGDVFSFVQRYDGVTFGEALDSLAQQAGVELPKGWKGKHADESARYAKLYDALERAERYYMRLLAGPSGKAAREYLEQRGLEKLTSETFGVGLSPVSGNPLLEFGQQEGGELLASLITAGLVRKGEDRSYDFFHGRLMIPIRDGRGRTVGFGGRRLDDRVDSPKYVNTPETPLFHKSRLIYGLDRATKAIRTSRHLILVEGYTDVMAAHQVGCGHVAAVLGTSTTEDHAGLVRRTGARRVTLVFDGDDAGRRATFRALEGLLPLQLELDVLRLPAGNDPCDLFMEEGEAGFSKRLESAFDWLEFALDGLAAETGSKLSDGVDQVLRLIQRLPKPVHRESSMVRIAEALELPVDSVRLQARDLVGRRRVARSDSGNSNGNGPDQSGKPKRGALIEPASTANPLITSNIDGSAPKLTRSGPATSPGNNFRGTTYTGDSPRHGVPSGSAFAEESDYDEIPSSEYAPSQFHNHQATPNRPGSVVGGGGSVPSESTGGASEPQAEQNPRPISPKERRQELRAYSDLVGAVLIDNSLIPAYSEGFADCPDENLAQILNTVLDLYENGSEDLEIDASSVMDALGAHPAREWIVPIEDRARRGESTRQVAEGAVGFLAKLRTRRSIAEHRHQFARAGDEASRSSALMDIWNESRRLKVPVASSRSGNANAPGANALESASDSHSGNSDNRSSGMETTDVSQSNYEK